MCAVRIGTRWALNMATVCSQFEQELYFSLLYFLFMLHLFPSLFLPSYTISLGLPVPSSHSADGRQSKSEKAASFPAVHVGFKLCPSFYSFLSHSPLGAAAQPQTSPPLHAREMPHACSQPSQVRVCMCLCASSFRFSYIALTTGNVCSSYLKYKVPEFIEIIQ